MNKGKLRLFDSESSYLVEKESLKYPTVSYVRDIDKVYYMIQNESLYEFVDLGLPSGTLWATCNVGANSPEETGLYFAWGETQGYTAEDVENGIKRFTWSDYKYAENDYDETNEDEYSPAGTLTKYFWEGGNGNGDSSSTGTPDDLKVLELVDDAAYQSDNICRMPTIEETEEMLNNVVETIIYNDDNVTIKGRLYTSTIDGYTDKSIFIPASGYAYYGNIEDFGLDGGFWTSSLCLYWDPKYARFFTFFEQTANGWGRRTGLPIRPVKSNN